MSNMPDPLVPKDCDLRNYPYMPVDINRLFDSRFHAICNDAEWRAGVTLWLKSFHQVPAASIPSDDIELCRLAELGRNIKAWRKVSEKALHGWILCNDGRYYHPIIAEKANEAFHNKQQRQKSAETRWAGARRDRVPPAPESAKSSVAATRKADADKIIEKQSVIDENTQNKQYDTVEDGSDDLMQTHCDGTTNADAIATREQCESMNTHHADAEQPHGDTASRSTKIVLSVNTICALLPGLSPSVAADYLTHRKAKKAPMTESAWKIICREIQKSGVSPDDALSEAMAAGWQGFKAEWLANRNKSGTQNGKDATSTYQDTSGNRPLSAVERVRLASASWAEREEQRLRESGSIIDIN